MEMVRISFLLLAKSQIKLYALTAMVLILSNSALLVRLLKHIHD